MCNFKLIANCFIVILIVNLTDSWGRNTDTNTFDREWIFDSIDVTKHFALEYYNIGDFEESLSYFKYLDVLYTSVHEFRIFDHATNYSNISLLFFYNREYDSAIFYLNLAEKIYTKELRLENEYLGKLYSDFGYLYENKGDYVQSRIFYEKALTYLARTSNKSFTRTASVLYNRLGLLEIAEGNNYHAIEYFSKGLKIVRDNYLGNSDLITSYLNLAIPYANLNQIRKSIEIQLKAIKLCQLDSVNNLTSLGKLYNNISLDYLELKELDSAEMYINKSLAIASSNARHTSYLADVYDSYGTLLRRRGENDEALNYYQKGIHTLSKGFKEDNPLVNPEPNQIVNKFPTLQLLKSKTSSLYEIFTDNHEIDYLEAAIKTAFLSIQLIDDLRNSYLSRESKLQLAKHEGETYKEALELCHLAYKILQDQKFIQLAFSIAEKSKSSVLLSSIREMEAKEFGGIPEDLLNQERVLSKRIAFYRENIYEENQNPEPDSVKIRTWESYLFQEQRQHDDLIKLFEKEYPAYFTLKYNTGTVDINVLQNDLKNTSVIEYAISDSSLFTFLIEKNNFLVHRQNIDSSFFKQIQSYLSIFQKFDFSKQSYSSFIEYCWQSKELYNLLLHPFTDQISGDHLLIVPDGILSYLPFETLIRQVPVEIPSDYYRSLHYILYDYAISYSYSSTLYHQVYSGNQLRNKKRLAAFAPEYSLNSFSNSLIGKQIVTRQKYRKNLYPIPGVMEEIEAISKIVTSDIFAGKEASETVFRRVASKYDLLHLAMHTVVDNNDPMFSKLIFTDTNDSVNDGLLNTFEIFGLKLRARMVVLSACSTGEGDYSDGEGVMSLARGFVYAGSPSLVMTMWEVEDKSSISLMKSFYHNLFSGKTKSEALQEAKIDFIRNARPENSHPFFWSTFVILGNNQAIAWSNGFIIMLILFSVAVSVGIIFSGYNIYQRNRNSSI